MEHGGLTGLHSGAVTFFEVDRGHLGCARGRRDAGFGRSIGGIGRRDHRTDVDDERERLVLADHVAAGLGPVGQIGRDVELQLGAGLGADESLLPTFDHTARSEHHRERLAAVVAVVELDAVGAPHADVVDDHGVAGLGGRTRALFEHRDLELGGDLVGDRDCRLVRAGRRRGAVFDRRGGIGSGRGRGLGGSDPPAGIGSSGRGSGRGGGLGRVGARAAVAPAGRKADDEDRGEQYGRHGPAHRRDATGRVCERHVASATSRAARQGARPASHSASARPSAVDGSARVNGQSSAAMRR